MLHSPSNIVTLLLATGRHLRVMGRYLPVLSVSLEQHLDWRGWVVSALGAGRVVHTERNGNRPPGKGVGRRGWVRMACCLGF